MLATLDKSVDRLVSEFSWRRFLGFVVFLALLVIGAALFERYTSSFRLARLERAASIVEVLEQQASSDERAQLDSIRVRILADLNATMQAPPLGLSLPELGEFEPPRWGLVSVLKFLAAGSIWWLFGLAAVAANRGAERSNAAAAMIGFSVLGLFAGGIAVFVPTLMWPWFNLVLVPAGVFLAFIALVVFIAWRGANGKEA